MSRGQRNEPPGLKCNAIDPSTPSGKCERSAGSRTKHPGFGPCHRHDNLNNGKGATKYVLPQPGPLAVLVEQQQKDLDIFNLRKEVAVSRAVEEYVQGLINSEEDPDELSKYLKTLNAFLQTTGKLVEKAHEIEKSRKYIISVDEVKAVMDAIVMIVLEEVRDHNLATRILNRILEQKVDNAITIPQDDWKYADEWAAAQPEPRKTDTEHVIETIADGIIPQEDPDQDDVRLSLSQFPARLRIDLPAESSESLDE